MADAKLSALSEISVPDFADTLYTVDDTGPTSYKVTAARALGQWMPATLHGRLTTESGVPISTADRTAQGTIYFTPHLGNRVALHDGTRWKMYVLTEISLALTVTSGKNYDVYLYDNAGTLTLELSAAWTTDNIRNAALAVQDGIVVKSSATTRRLVGMIRASGTNVTEDSNANRFVWSLGQQTRRPFGKAEGAESHLYTTAALRNFNNNTDTQANFICGLVTEKVTWGIGAKFGAVGVGAQSNSLVGMAINGTDIAAPVMQLYSPAGGVYLAGTITYESFPILGLNTLIARENGNGAAASNFENGVTFGALSC